MITVIQKLEINAYRLTAGWKCRARIAHTHAVGRCVSRVAPAEVRIRVRRSWPVDKHTIGQATEERETASDDARQDCYCCLPRLNLSSHRVLGRAVRGQPPRIQAPAGGTRPSRSARTEGLAQPWRISACMKGAHTKAVDSYASTHPYLLNNRCTTATMAIDPLC